MTDLKAIEAQPILKWAGGKRWLLGDIAVPILRYLSRSGGRYIEPFLGGGAVALHLGLPGMLLNDALPELVNLYTQVRDNPAKVAWGLSAIACGGVDEEDFLKVRAMRPRKPYVQAGRMLYMNRLGFNGMYRLNGDGDFNVPFGKRATKKPKNQPAEGTLSLMYTEEPYRESVVTRESRDDIGSLFPHKGKLEAVARALATSTITCGDFEPVVDQACEGDFILADPPYDGAGEMYTSAGFDAGDQRRLAGALKRAVDRGAAVMMTNSDTPLIRELYAWAEVRATSESRTINSDVKGRQRAACVLALAGMGDVTVPHQMEMFA